METFRGDEQRADFLRRDADTQAAMSDAGYDGSGCCAAAIDDGTNDISYKPHLRELLRSVRLDVDYHRGQGDWLFRFDGSGREVAALDLVSGYGTLLFGHNHPELLDEAIRFLKSGACNHVQGSVSQLEQSLRYVPLHIAEERWVSSGTSHHRSTEEHPKKQAPASVIPRLPKLFSARTVPRF